MTEMSTTSSPGPVWWQQWEYNWWWQKGESLQDVMNSVGEEAAKMGLNGWEMITGSAQRTQVGHSSKTRNRTTDEKLFFEWSIACFFKRPIASPTQTT